MHELRFRNILVHVACQSDDDPAIRNAVAIAQRHAATLTLFDVAADLSWPMQYLAGGWEQTIEQISGGKQKKLRERSEALAADGLATASVMAEGRLSVAIVRQVIAGKHDLVIKVAEDSGPNRSGFLGSTDFRLLRKCPCPLLILRHDDQVGFQRVAVALDVMDDHELQQNLDKKVVQAAHSLCLGRLDLLYAMRGLEEIMHVEHADADLVTPDQVAQWDADLHKSAHQKLNGINEQLGANRSAYHVLAGAPEVAIPKFVGDHDMDLLAMGTVARSGLDGMLIGNTAERILNNVTCSVLALKPDKFVSPFAAGAYCTVRV